MSDNLTAQVQRLKIFRPDSADDLEALLEVSKLLHTTVDIGALFALVVEKAVALTNADRGGLLSVKNGQAQVEIARNRQGDFLDDFRLSRTIVNAVLPKNRPSPGQTPGMMRRWPIKPACAILASAWLSARQL
jgi:hypothetical protein